MTDLMYAWLGGVVLGLSIAMPIGPINVEIIRRHLGQGFAAGLLLGLGACSVDTAYIVLISLGLISAKPSPMVQNVLAFAAAAILVVLAAMILRSARSSARSAAASTAANDRPTHRWRHYVVGVAMTAVNPMNLVFWFGIIVSGQNTSDPHLGPWPTVAGVMCGTTCWVLGLNLALIAGRRLLRPGVLVAINVLSAGVLLAKAAQSVWPMLAIR
jgi:L-lysine exporter family protein LysE/ArgO